MTSTYEQVAEKYLLEDEMLWSVYRFKIKMICVTDKRVILIRTNSNTMESYNAISLTKIKLITTRWSSRLKSIVSIYYEDGVLNISMESERVDRIINDILKHKG